MSQKVLYGQDAIDLAFDLGQHLQKVLLQRGIQAARDANESLVTVETLVRVGMDESLVEQLRTFLHEQSKSTKAA